MLAECVRVIRADEAGPVALDDGHDGVVDTTGFVGVGSAAVGILGTEDGVDFDRVGDAGACCAHDQYIIVRVRTWETYLKLQPEDR